MGEARDSAAPKKDKSLPPTGHHIMANGNEIINTLACWFGIDKGCSIVL
jgi:hypothetical protein